MVEFTIVGEELWARMERALEKVNELLRKTVRILDIFLEHAQVSARDAVHVILVGKVERIGDEPNPDIEPWVRANDFRAIALETLVRMKLNAFQDKDRVHLRDMISLGLIDSLWLARYPEPFQKRLQDLLNDPDG